MKKIIASAVGLMLAGGIVTTASAVETQFGGYWRTRFTHEDNFSGKDTASVDYVDTRTRLYLTAKFSDDFKFVNKFEINNGWGDNTKTQTAKIQTGTKLNADGTTSPVYTTGDVSSAGLGSGGDLGADGKGNIRLKNSYADFNMGPMVNAKVGIQPFKVARGFIINDDASGVILTGKFGMVTVPLVWMNLSNEETYPGDTADVANMDQNIWAALVSVKINDNMSVTPYFVYHTLTASETLEDSKNWYLGADADLKFGSVSLWGTGIYNGGDFNNQDNKGYLGALGVDAGIAHGQFFYASGDDNADDQDNDAFISAPGPGAGKRVGSSYYWAEIMGYGMFDNHLSSGSPGDDISNVMAGNAGVTIKPMDKLAINGDLWYAALAQDNANGDKELGWEFDAKVSYKIYDNLTADAIFAYLLSGDATGDEDVTEGGLQLSLSF
ncbi:MAG: hypothetical protein V2B20_15050 [Pseudomonadota bacterium]